MVRLKNMIKLNAPQKNVRETTAAFFFSDDEAGEVQSKQIRVRYRALTVGALKARRAAIQVRLEEDPEAIVWLSDSLVERIESLPDIEGSDGKPLEITIENLDLIDTKNLESIQKAIDDDIAGKSQPAK